MISPLRALAMASLALTACATPAPVAPPRLTEIVHPGRVTVVTFFSADCPCQRAHDARLRELYDRYHAQGVDFVAVDAEATSTPARDAEEAKRRAYPFPIVSDPDGAIADALSAEYATFSLVFDDKGQIRYRGGLDSDKVYLTEGASLWVRDALDHVLAGRAPDPAETKTLGCSLRRR